MITTNAGFDSAAAAPVVGGPVTLLELYFTSGTLFLTTWPVDLLVGAQTYTGVGTVGSVGEMKESEDGQSQMMPLVLSQVPITQLALALGSPTVYQGRVALAKILVLTPELAQSGSPVLRFSGFMDRVKIKRAGNNAGEITLECITGGYDVRRSPVGLRINDIQHQSAHAGELAFQYVQGLIGNPQLWLTKRFQSV